METSTVAPSPQTSTPAPLPQSTDVNKKKPKQNFTLWEDVGILEGVIKHGAVKWNKVREYMETVLKIEGRSDESIATRFKSIKGKDSKYNKPFEKDTKWSSLPKDAEIGNKADYLEKIADLAQADNDAEKMFYYCKKMIEQIRTANIPVSTDDAVNLTDEDVGKLLNQK